MLLYIFALLALPFWAACSPHLNPRATGSFKLLADKTAFTFQYSANSPNSKNWIGVYHADHGGPVNEEFVEQSLAWAYAPAANGEVLVDASSLAVGEYEAYFLANDGYKWIANPIKITRKADSVLFYSSTATLKTGRVGQAYEADIKGLLRGTGTFSISSNSGASWAQISSAGKITGTPSSANSAGKVTITAKGSNGATTQLTVTIPIVGSGSPIVEHLKVLTWNLWHGGTQVNDYHAKQVRFLAQANVDIVVMQETTGDHANRLATAMGWNAWQGPNSVGIISRYPIPSKYSEHGHGGAVRVSLDGTKTQVNVWGVHLTAYPYGPYGFCFDGSSTATVLAGEESSGRAPQIRTTISRMQSDLGNTDSIPVLLAGDFNAPSHLDYTSATSSSHCNAGSVQWPTSKIPTDAGLTDSYRKINTNPVSNPGITWSPVVRANDGEPEPQDRIDFIYHKGKLTVESAETVVVGDPEISPFHANNEWTSDHAAVLVKYDIRSYV